MHSISTRFSVIGSQYSAGTGRANRTSCACSRPEALTPNRARSL
ncbi:hypothetical protein HMPREF9579_02058 [Cutibacterium acnes HL087PA1]|nr:hypothetical protein HMPREF9567_01495 [Cutibacterium acnes HL013PA1]EGF68006.1 hypothetical protein HMPREF9579_02058 [Cutibacterium acnes HL087PA1]